jgi:tRNA A-37 threonylcarbamoyl transferase component Bud32
MKVCPECNIRYPSDAAYCFLDGRVLAVLPDALLGATLGGRYLVECAIGEGGMAIVYRANHKWVDRPCAIKVMNPALTTDSTVVERFRREAKAVQRIAHPNIIEIFDQGQTEQGTPYIVMELLDGASLAALIAEGPMALARSVPIMIQIARGIARAHDLGVVHRDLKPENVFVCRRADGTDLVKILDFGIARSRTDARLTDVGELFGTPQYLAPERISTGASGPSVDLYALGVVFFELITASLPFEADDPATLFIKHMRDKPASPRSLDARIPEALDRLVLQLLEKDPSLRPVDAHRIERDLVAIAQSIAAPVPPSPEEDLTSSRMPARARPAQVVLLWNRRLEVFHKMLAGTEEKARSTELDEILAQLAKRVTEIADVRAAVAMEQRILEKVDARGHDGRQRFGFAVNALGLDASRAKDGLRAAQVELERLAGEAKQATEKYFETLREVVTWEGRSGLQEPYAELARAYRSCAAAVDAWANRRKAERTAQANAERCQQAVTDLDYQIAQLRAALANHELELEHHHGAGERKLADLNARADAIETELIRFATQFCDPLRNRPELVPLFHQLEAEAAGSAWPSRAAQAS